VVAGGYAAGKQVCVHATVNVVQQGADGLYDLRLGSPPYLFVDVPPMYVAAGVTLPMAGQTITVHGTVRWDAGHADWELAPVDWIGP
jgi:hypothetical protein